MKRTLPLEAAAADSTAAEPSPSATNPSVAVIRSKDLFGERRELLIEHAGSQYRLRITHSNKLILTK